MIKLFNGLRDMTLLSVMVRMLCAMLCGGIIGIEREYKRRPAGFRTHILICMGAAMTTLTSQYLYLCMGYYTDMARLGAQVIAGIGFIGAGTIIVTKQQRVKGLTTAAGLWVSAIVGLTIGAGFFEGGIFVTCLVLAAELLFVKLEYRLLNSARERIYYIEYSDKECLETILGLFKENGIRVLNMEITRAEENEEHSASAIFYTRIKKYKEAINIESLLNPVQGLHLIEEL